ncbi:MAG TPA: SusC/RagA family TonB-linked outer membrane protein, partial [Caldithrix abyssi]|nr:SusC/RagA family TonB-linked outer membrane protein [Caldithrix abyssi]
GSRAANGVILITTKSGKPGKVRATYKITSSSDEVTQLPELQTKYGQGLFGGRFGNIFTSWGPKLDTVANVSIYDHAKELFRTGNRIEQNLSLSGGSKTTDYYLSFGRTDHQGFIKGNNDYERSSFRLKATQRVGTQLDITGNIAYVSTKANRLQRGSNTSGLLLGAFRTPPDFNNLPYLDPVTGLHRSYRYPNPTELKVSRGYDNPFFIANEQVNLTEVGRVYGNFTVNYDPLDWLNVRYILGRDYSNDERRYVLPPSSSTAPEGTITRSKFTTQETEGNLIIKASGNFDFADMAVTAYVGHNWNERKYNSFTTVGDNMSVYGFNQLGNTSSYSPSEYESIVRLESFYGQVTFDLWNQLFITTALRNDGFSTYNKGENRFWFPKISTAWEFTKLPVFSESELLKKWLPYGKVRLAYGETGREAPAYSTISAFSQGAFGSGWGEVLNSTAYGYGGFFTSGLRGNTDLSVERAKEIEYGIELGLIENRLSFDLTIYDQETEDVIYPIALAPSTGFFSQFRNAAVIQNKGIEIGINARPINMKNFKWDMNLQYGQNKSEVLSLPDVDYYYLGGFSSLAAYAVEGQPLGVFRGGDFVRFGRGIVTNVVDENGNVQQGVNIDEAYSGWKNGDLFVNGDGYPILDPEDRILGDPNPDWTGSIRNTFTIFRKWRISTLFDIKQGGDIWNGTKGALMFFGTAKETEDRDGTRVFEGAGPGQGKEVSNLGFYNWIGASGLGNGFTGPSSQYIEDGSYVKLRELSLSYLLDMPEITNWTGLRDIELTLTGRNLFTWTDYTGIDPETNLGGNVSWRGFDYFNMPQTRSIIFGLRFNY